MSLIQKALFKELAESSLTIFYGEEPAALLDIKERVESLFPDTISTSEIGEETSWADLRGKVRDLRVEAIKERKPAFAFTTVASPSYAAESDNYIKVGYYDNRFLNQGPRLVELSIEKSRGYTIPSGESVVINPYEKS